MGSPAPTLSSQPALAGTAAAAGDVVIAPVVWSSAMVCASCSSRLRSSRSYATKAPACHVSRGSACTADTIGPALLGAQPRLPAAWHPWLIWGGAAVDLLLGLAMWLRPGRLVWGLALLATTAMTATATWVDPMLWWHPLGPLTKNLPIIALLWALHRASS